MQCCKQSFIRIAILTMLTTKLTYVAGHAQTLSQPTPLNSEKAAATLVRTVEMTGTQLPDQSYVGFNSGYFYQFQRTVDSPSRPSIKMRTAAGESKSLSVPWPQGTSRVYMTAMDVARDGSIVLAGQFEDQSGARNCFIDIIDANSSEPRIISTGRYMPSKIAMATDGTFWVTGAERPSAAMAGVLPRHSGDLLRHYSREGAILHRASPQSAAVGSSALPTGDSSGSVRARESRSFADGALSQMWLRATDDGAVIYDSKFGIIYRYKLSDGRLAKEHVMLHNREGAKVTGLAVLNDGSIFVSMLGAGNSNVRSQKIFRLSSDSATGISSWIRPPELKSWTRMARLLGSESNQLVLRENQGRVNWLLLQ